MGKRKLNWRCRIFGHRPMYRTYGTKPYHDIVGVKRSCRRCLQALSS